MITMTKKEWFALGTDLYGDDYFQWKFICPSCGHVQTPEDFRPYKNNGATPDTARFSCIGRYDGHMDVSIFASPGPCNYTSGGLFPLAPVEVVDDDKKHLVFAFKDMVMEK